MNGFMEILINGLGWLMLALFTLGMLAPQVVMFGWFGDKLGRNRKGVGRLVAILFCFAFITVGISETFFKSHEEIAISEEQNLAEKTKQEEKRKVEEREKLELQRNAEIVQKQKEQEAKKEAEKEQQKKESKINNALPLTYHEVARYPQRYKAKTFMFTGNIIQVIEGGYVKEYLVVLHKNAKSAYQGDLVRVTYPSVNQEDSKRFLEDDMVVVWGDFKEITSYKTVRGDTKSVPEFEALRIKLMN
jgi:hypothetical protein